MTDDEQEPQMLDDEPHQTTAYSRMRQYRADGLQSNPRNPALLKYNLG